MWIIHDVAPALLHQLLFQDVVPTPGNIDLTNRLSPYAYLLVPGPLGRSNPTLKN